MPGVGPKLAVRLEQAGYADLESLARAVPTRYRRVFATALPDDGMIDQELRVPLQIEGARRLRTRRGLSFTVLRARLAEDPACRVEARFFGQPWISTQVSAGDERLCEGRWRRQGGRHVLEAPRLLPAKTSFAAGPLLVPERRSPVDGMSAERFGEFAKKALELCGEHLVDDVVPALREELGLPELVTALRTMHEPDGDPETLEASRRRLAFDEAVQLLADVRARRRRRESRKAPPIEMRSEVVERIGQRLPFEFSDEQRRAANEIAHDMARPVPMARLLMGDVGCGKTLVAVHACLAACAAGSSAVLLAPTEILAEQHARRISSWLAGSRLPVLCFTGSQSAAGRKESLGLLASPRACLAIGTHALFGKDVELAGLGLLVVDEQQRFGVRQRASLWRERNGLWPHVLVMSATPIPRTLAMASFGDLDISEIRSAPVARPAPQTELHARDEWPRVRARIAEEVERGGRVFVVCPRIGESAREDEPEDGALATFEELRPLFSTALIHGRLDARAKSAAQDAFRRGEKPCLVGTTVLEVGIDVPEATMMVVRGAERLGLATLHQLRGRVGRGDRAATCLFVRDPRATRLDILAECSDGFALAEADLRERGAGEIAGVAQSGHRGFQCLDLARDLDLLRAANRG